MVQTKQRRTAQRSANGEGLPALRRFGVVEFDRMVELGILREDERVELLEGVIVCMAPMGSRHMAIISRLTDRLVPSLLGRAIVRIQGAVRLAPDSEPEPDIAVVRYRNDAYEGRHPEPADILLVIEVAHSSLARDRGRKLAIYATAGIPETWIFDVTHKQIYVNREPQGRRYRQVEIVPLDGTLSPAAFPDLVLKVAELFG